jgi:branched-chain amino acid transport system permease protein
MRNNASSSLRPILAILAVVTIAPAVIYPIFLMKVMCFAIFACAVNLLVGYVGLLSLGHSMFFGMAAYLTAYTLKEWGWPVEAALACAVLASMVMGTLAGWIAIRRQGIYFAMITLALAQMVYFFCLQAPFTGGEDGLQKVPRPVVLGVLDTASDGALYTFVVMIFLVALAIYHRTIHSPFGQVLEAIRDNEPRAISLGYRVNRYKLLAFVISAALTGLAGGTKALIFQLASLTDVNWHMGTEVVLMVLVGGMGTLFGPLAGAVAILAMQEYLAPLGEWVMVIQGVILVTVVMLFRRGMVGEFDAWRVRRQTRGALVRQTAEHRHSHAAPVVGGPRER